MEKKYKNKECVFCIINTCTIVCWLTVQIGGLLVLYGRQVTQVGKIHLHPFWFSTRPHQNNKSWLGFLKILNYVPKEREKYTAKNKIICKSSNWQHIQRLKITILGANWQLFRLERIAKCSYFILSTQNINFYWFVMKIKKFMLPIWWYNRGCFLLGINIWGLRSEIHICDKWVCNTETSMVWLRCLIWFSY